MQNSAVISIVCKWSKQPCRMIIPWDYLFFSLLSEEVEFIVCLIPFAINILKTGLSVSSEIK